MLGAVEETSMGLLSITPRNAEGEPLTADELVHYVVRDAEGVPLKEWYAIASYLKKMGGTMDEQYAATDGRKVVYSSLSPADLLRNANHFTFLLLGVLLLLLGLLTLLTLLIVRKIRRKKIH